MSKDVPKDLIISTDLFGYGVVRFCSDIGQILVRFFDDIGQIVSPIFGSFGQI